MKKIALGLVLVAAMLSANDMDSELNMLDASDMDGAFVGFGIGFGDGNISSTTTNISIDSNGKSGKTLDGVPSFELEIVGGYKYFINEYFGVRAYGQFIYSPTTYSSYRYSYGGNTHQRDLSSNNFEINANVDLLANFINNGTGSVGAYLGVGIGASIYDKMIAKKSVEIPRTHEITGLSAGLNLALNVGLRSVVAVNHGIEIGARIPLTPYFMPTELTPPAGSRNAKSVMGVAKVYAVTLRYIYNF